MTFYPPDGEFVVMNYRVTGEFRAPFRVFPSIDELSPYRIDVVVRLRADMPEAYYGVNMVKERQRERQHHHKTEREREIIITRETKRG